MVGRLVEEHRVRAHQQDAGERDAHLPAAGELGDVAVHHLLLEPEAGEDLPGPRLEPVAAELLVARLDLAEARDELVELVEALGVGHRLLERMQLGRDLGDRPGAVHGLLDHGLAGHLADILAEVADGHAAVDGDLALVGLLLAHDHAKERRLAGAVGADEADLLAAVDGGGGLDEQELFPVLLADAVETNHVMAVPGGRSARR